MQAPRGRRVNWLASKYTEHGAVEREVVDERDQRPEKNRADAGEEPTTKARMESPKSPMPRVLKSICLIHVSAAPGVTLPAREKPKLAAARDRPRAKRAVSSLA